MIEYRLQYTKRAKNDIVKFKEAGNKAALKKVDVLLKELAKHPKTGTGHPEQLKGHLNHWSRRITEKHRLIYEIKDEIVLVVVISAYGHYDDN